MKGAIYVSNSGNRKIAGNKKVDATYSSIELTCPTTCPLKGDTCYASQGYVALTSNRLDKEADGYSSIQVSREEAKAIDHSYDGGPVPSGRDLRLHVAGDVRSKYAAQLLASAIARWKNRNGGNCWTYTHSWRDIPRFAWGKISVLASIENPKDAKLAMAKGYAPALVVPEHKSNKAYYLEGSNVKWVPCPAQTRDDVSCVSCRLCFDTDGLRARNTGIAFAAHGSGTNKLKRKLKVLQ